MYTVYTSLWYILNYYLTLRKQMFYILLNFIDMSLNMRKEKKYSLTSQTNLSFFVKYFIFIFI